jgi:cytochrome c-type biogenesis protein CcmH
MKNIVRERLNEGASEQEILDFFVSRYGEDVLAAPPARGFNLTIWVVGALTLPSAILILMLTLRSMRNTTKYQASSKETSSIKGIDKYLSQADKEISDFLNSNEKNDKSDEV